MQVSILSVADLGLAVRATRRAYRLRLDDVASSAQVGTQFAGELERGKETVQLGKVLQVLQELGIKVVLDVPSSVAETLETLREKGVKPVKPRRRTTNTGKP